MDLKALKKFFDRAVIEKGSALWRVYPSSTSNRQIASNFEETDPELSYMLLNDYIIGQANEGVPMFDVRIFSNPKDSNPARWTIRNKQGATQLASIAGTGVMRANVAVSNEMKELREMLKVQSVMIEKQNHRFEIYQKEIAHQALMDAERGKTYAAEQALIDYKKSKKEWWESMLDHKVIGPIAGQVVGNAAANFMGNTPPAIAGAAAGATVPADAAAQAGAAENDDTSAVTGHQEESEDNTALSEEELTVLNAYDHLKANGIGNPEELLFFFSLWIAGDERIKIESVHPETFLQRFNTAVGVLKAQA